MAYREISLSDAASLPSNCEHAAHVMLYSRVTDKLFGVYPYASVIMMQLRFDGTLGFIGGVVDSGETPEEACTRECCEELGISPSSLSAVSSNDHVSTEYSDCSNFCLHFYAKQVPYDMFKLMEKEALQSNDWGQEVQGIVRCPTYTLPNGLGFPAFLRNQFINNARDQLIRAIRKVGLLSEEQIKEAMKISESVNCMVTVENTRYD